jgi:formylglycine-generating enzyme required for sulfatase activity
MEERFLSIRKSIMKKFFIIPVALAIIPMTMFPEKSASGTFPSDFVFVEGGTFCMGDPEEKINQRHQETVGSFYICNYEVTQKEYMEVTGKNPSRFKGDSRPVESVSFYDSIEYCNKLSEKEGFTPCYKKITQENKNTFKTNDIYGEWAQDKNADGYRLPTEAEWEYAARGGKKSNGCAYSGSNEIEETGWYGSNSGEKSHDVMTKSPNELGLYDMSGNVFEWCAGFFGKSNDMIIRGGSFYASRIYCFTYYRTWFDPADSHAMIGFRVVRGK